MLNVCFYLIFTHFLYYYINYEHFKNNLNYNYLEITHIHTHKFSDMKIYFIANLKHLNFCTLQILNNLCNQNKLTKINSC